MWKKKKHVNISKAAGCGHPWGVRLEGGEERELGHVPWNYQAFHFLLALLAQSFSGHGPLQLPAKRTTTSACFCRAGMPIHPHGFQTFLGFFLEGGTSVSLPSTKTSQGRPMLKTRSCLCPAGIWAKSSLSSKEPEAQRGDVICLMAQLQSVTGTKLPHNLETVFFFNKCMYSAC